jgi:flagellin-like protein
VKVQTVEVDYVLKMLKSKRGISPILATLLLIVIAVAAIIVTYAWVMTFTGSQTTTAGKMIQFDSAVINSGTDKATVYVRNTGTEDVTIDKIYVEGTDYSASASGLGVTLSTSGASAIATVTLDGTQAGLDFIAGSTYKLKVTGPGVFWEQPVKAV